MKGDGRVDGTREKEMLGAVDGRFPRLPRNDEGLLAVPIRVVLPVTVVGILTCVILDACRRGWLRFTLSLSL